MAIELLSPRSVALEEQDTLLLEARVLDVDGNPIDVAITWEVLPRDTVPVGVELDPGSGRVVAVTPGEWDVRARVEALPTDPVTIVVTPAPDSIVVVGDTAVTVPPAATASSSLQVELLDVTTTPATPTSLNAKPVTFRVTFPVFVPGTRSVALQGGTVAEDSLSAVVITTVQGAGIMVRRSGASQPDSVIVEAEAETAVGGGVAGSPVRFVVHFPVN